MNNEKKEEMFKRFDERCKKGNRLSFLAKGAKDEIKSFIQSEVDLAVANTEKEYRFCVQSNLFSHRNRLCKCYKTNKFK